MQKIWADIKKESNVVKAGKFTGSQANL